MKSFLDILKEKIIVFDGATGTNLQTQNLSADDFGGEEYNGCNEYLLISKPSAMEKVHVDFLQAGADVIETNTFGSASIVLAEYGLQDRAYELSRLGAELAKKCTVNFSTPDKPRFVAGSIGPTTKLPSLGHIDFESMRKAFYDQMAGLMDGGADLFCIETCQDILQTKIALCAAQDLFKDRKKKIPVIVSVTVETTGTMLMGTEISAALTTLEPFDIVDVVGMNCATGPKEMSENIRFLCHNSPKPVFCMPNAGIPENIGGKAHYHLSPDELTKWLSHFSKDFGVNIVGGCCGTTPAHIKALADHAGALNPRGREWTYIPSVSSLYASVPMHIDPAPIIIGERTNANGSKKIQRTSHSGRL